MISNASLSPAPTSQSKFVGAAIAASVIGVVAATDQLSKMLAVSRLIDGPAEAPGPFWFRLVANRGAFMGLPLPSWFLLAAAIVVLTMALSALADNAPRPIIVGWGLIVGGAAGNLADRFQHRPRFPDHAVVDWVASTSLPTFNLADVAIAAGLAIITLTTASTPSLPTRRQRN